MKTALVVLNFNDAERSLGVCRSASRSQRFSHLIIVDNHSSDLSMKVLQNASISRLSIISSSSNLGYCGGVNLGLKKACEQFSSDFVFLLNSDVTFSDESFQMCIHFLEANPSYAACAPLMKNPDGKFDYNWGNFPTFFSGLKSFFYFGNKSKLSQEYADSDSIFESHQTNVDWIRGSFVCFRATALRQCRYFDDSFFLYCGEPAFFLVLKQAGWNAAILGDSFYVHHHVSHETFRSLRRKKWSSVHSMIRFLKKYKKCNFIERLALFLAAPFAVLEYDFLYLRIAFRKRGKHH